MKPHLVKWDEKFRKSGLKIIDVDDGNSDAKKDLEKLAKDDKLAYTIVWDQGGKICKQFEIEGYPAAYLVGVDGKVIWEGFPLPKVEEIEKLIDDETKKVSEKVKKEIEKEDK